MVSDADKQGLRHKARHKITVGDLMAGLYSEDTLSAALEGFRLSPEITYLRLWGCFDDTDPQVASILERMWKLWPRLLPEHRELYLRTAESIAEAEGAKKAWNPKVSRDRYVTLSRNAIKAAKLAKNLAAMFPPPWTGEQAPIGALIEGLASFARGSMHAAMPIDRIKSAIRAHSLLRQTKARISRKSKRIHWELIRDLAWLASARNAEPDERTVRRYLEKQRLAKTPADAYWKSNRELLREVSGLVPYMKERPLEELARRYLQSVIV